MPSLRIREFHGETYTRLYLIWNNMRKRCLSKNNSSYKWYGGKGIKVHKSFEYFSDFKKWALENGYRDKLTIDRINSKGDYEPENCRWVTRSENSSFSRLPLGRDKCSRGHLWKKETTYSYSSGQRACKTCISLRMKKPKVDPHTSE